MGVGGQFTRQNKHARIVNTLLKNKNGKRRLSHSRAYYKT